jgi:hypothetical protein
MLAEKVARGSSRAAAVSTVCTHGVSTDPADEGMVRRDTACVLGATSYGVVLMP